MTWPPMSRLTGGDLGAGAPREEKSAMKAMKVDISVAREDFRAGIKIILPKLTPSVVPSETLLEDWSHRPVSSAEEKSTQVLI